MTWSTTAPFLALLMLCSACGTLGQTGSSSPQSSATQSGETSSPLPAGQAPLPKPQFFGGTVTALDAGHITVTRTTAGRSPEHRTFLISPKTKMTKSVKVRARVTVRYRHMPEGDIALEIQLLPLKRIPRVS